MIGVIAFEINIKIITNAIFLMNITVNNAFRFNESY